MRKLTILALCLALLGCARTTKTDQVNELTLKEALKDKFLIGTALNVDQIWEKDSVTDKIIKQQFNAIVAEDCMKAMYMQPKEGEFYFKDADKFVEYGEKNNMYMTGHVLTWHSQPAEWFFTDANGKDVSPEVLTERIKKHITTIVSRYKGKIKGWDVVNEAILDDGSWRDSKFYQILGEDFLYLSFKFANEADPDAELYYNDYNEWHKGKQKTVLKIIENLKAKGLRIDAIGMQGHIGMTYPSIEEYKAAIDTYTAAGVKVMITELEMSALPLANANVGANISDTIAYRAEVNPYTTGLPDSISMVWNKRMGDFFKLFIDNSQNIKRVTLWGVTDATSWKNDFPVVGRTDYPLLFDRENKAKPVVKEIIEMAKTDSSKKNIAQ